MYAAVLVDYPGRRSPVGVCGFTTLHPFYTESRPLDGQESTDAWQFSDEAAERMKEVLPSIEQSTIESFRAENLGPAKVNPQSIQIPGVSVVTEGCDQDLRESSYGQLVEVSAVGFSDDRAQALVYLGVLDGQTGRGWFILLERSDGRWLEVERIQAWVA